MRSVQRDKPGRLGALVLGASSLILPLLRIRPNRILMGEALRLPELTGWGLPFAAAIAVAACVFLLAPARYRPLRQTAAALGTALPLVALAWAAQVPALQGEGNRLSLSFGFLGMLLGSVLMLWSLGKGPAGRWLRGGWLLLFLALLLGGRYDALSLMQEYAIRRDAFWAHVGRHVVLALSATLGALALGLPLAALLWRRPRVRRGVMAVLNVGQTIPTLSLLGLLMAPLSWLGRNSPLLNSWGVSGVGFWPAWIALFVYCLFPILYNALAGLSLVDPDVTHAGTAMGMSGTQVFLRIRLPLAAPLMLTGTRIALTQSMGNATLAALIGGGGLGSFIFLGMAQSAADLILLGTLPLIALATLSDGAMGWLARRIQRRDLHD